MDHYSSPAQFDSEPMNRFAVSYTSTALVPAPSSHVHGYLPARTTPVLFNPIVPLSHRLPPPKYLPSYVRLTCSPNCPCLFCKQHSKDTIQSVRTSMMREALNFVTAAMDSFLEAVGHIGRWV